MTSLPSFPFCQRSARSNFHSLFGSGLGFCWWTIGSILSLSVCLFLFRRNIWIGSCSTRPRVGCDWNILSWLVGWLPLKALWYFGSGCLFYCFLFFCFVDEVSLQTSLCIPLFRFWLPWICLKLFALNMAQNQILKEWLIRFSKEATSSFGGFLTLLTETFIGDP